MHCHSNPRTFSQESYDVNDTLAKALFVPFLQKRGHQIAKTSEDYYHDVISKYGLKTFYFELEVKTGYPFEDATTYPFDTVSFLGRKQRLCERHSFYYVIICKETHTAVCCHSDDIYQDKYLEVKYIDKENTKGYDNLYRVPKELCDFFNL